jgi:hypothetical protein
MDIKLKNIKHMPSLSEETECFSATIYIDGVKKGTASNRGHGGPNEIHPYALADEINTYAKTLPHIVSSFKTEDGAPYTYEQSADSVLSEILQTELENKRFKKLCLKNTLFRIADQDYEEGSWSKYNVKFTQEVANKLYAKYPNCTILNETL